MSGEKARDSGISAILAKNKEWLEEVSGLFNSHFIPSTHGKPFLMEDVKALLEPMMAEKPTHHNAWGAFALQLVRGKRIAPTGEWIKAKVIKSHARRMPLYVAVPWTNVPETEETVD